MLLAFHSASWKLFSLIKSMLRSSWGKEESFTLLQTPDASSNEWKWMNATGNCSAFFFLWIITRSSSSSPYLTTLLMGFPCQMSEKFPALSKRRSVWNYQTGFLAKCWRRVSWRWKTLHFLSRSEWRCSRRGQAKWYFK